jgi:hypothetical protein
MAEKAYTQHAYHVPLSVICEAAGIEVPEGSTVRSSASYVRTTEHRDDPAGPGVQVTVRVSEGPGRPDPADYFGG